MLPLDKLYCQDPSVAFSRYGDKYIIIPLKRDEGRIEDNIFILDNVAARIWELLDGSQKLSSVVERILEEYDADEEEAKKDVIKFLKELKGIQAVVIVKCKLKI